MASLLSGPIPQHPMYNKAGVSSSPRMGPRVKPEALSFASHGQKGTIANVFEIKGTSYSYPSPRKPKKEPANHVAENVKRMRQIQRKCRQKQREEVASAPVPVKALWKSQKYETIPSRLGEYLHSSPACTPREDQPRPASANFLRAHSKTGLPPRPQSSRTPQAPREASSHPARASSPKPNTDNNGTPVERLEGFPKRRSNSMCDLSATGTAVNFIKLNALAASRNQVKRPPSQQSVEDSMHIKSERYNEYKRNTRGSVPKYLEKRKDEWKQEEQERIRNIPDPDMPPGHKLMPSAERYETLDLLQKSHKELTSKLAALPIRSDTMRVRNAKEQLEAKLCEVEEAIKVFSRPKVFVKCDE